MVITVAITICGYTKEFFIEADLDTSGPEVIKITFVQSIKNEWFSLGWWAGILDIDGSLTASLTT